MNAAREKRASFCIEKDVNETAHFHPEVEVIYVIKGSIGVTIKDSVCLMHKEDILIINSSIRHSVRSGEGAILGRVRYFNRVLTEQLGINQITFYGNSTVDNMRPYESLRSIFRELILQEVHTSRKSGCLKESLLYKMLDQMIERFELENNLRERGKLSDDERLQRIVQFVNENYRESLSLTKLADELYVSTSTLSRFFKKQTGLYFADYVNRVRAEGALQELSYSDDNIAKIAAHCGFSNSSMLNKVFRDIYGMAPTEYRKMRSAEATRKQEEAQNLRNALIQEVQVAYIGGSDKRQTGRFQVTVKANSGEKYHKNWTQVINIGSITDMTHAKLQQHLKYLTETLGFQYARIWNTFAKEIRLCDGIHTQYYNYDKIDEVLDFLVAYHIKPWLDLGKRQHIILRGESQAVCREDEYIDFHTREAWEATVQDFINHCIRRYGKEEVNTWIFELSISRLSRNMGYYRNGTDDVVENFAFVYQTIKAAAPLAKVGGPMADPSWEVPLQENFLSYCKQHDCVPDYYSFMLYPYETAWSEQDDSAIGYRSSDRDWERKQVQQMKRLMRDAGLEQVPIYISEWNNSLSNRNYINDSCFRGTYLAYTISQLWNEVDLIAVRMGSDWVGDYYDSVSIANGDGGLLTKAGIRKPAYYAMRFLSELGDYIIQRGSNYIITRNEKMEYSILCFNYKWYGSAYFLQDEYTNIPDQIQHLFADEEPIELTIALTGLVEEKVYNVSKCAIHPGAGNLLDEWRHFQYASMLKSRDVSYLQEICYPRMSREQIAVVHGTLRLRQVLQAHEVCILHIYEEESAQVTTISEDRT